MQKESSIENVLFNYSGAAILNGVGSGKTKTQCEKTRIYNHVTQCSNADCTEW